MNYYIARLILMVVFGYCLGQLFTWVGVRIRTFPDMLFARRFWFAFGVVGCLAIVSAYVFVLSQMDHP